MRRSLNLLLFLIIAGCAATNPAPPPANLPTQSPFQYVIGPGDVLQVAVWQHPDLSASVEVLPDGTISLPLIGEVRAVGMGVESLSETVQEQFAEYVRHPKVTVGVAKPDTADYAHRVRVTGSVRQQLSVPYRKGMTVMDLVLEAGGPDEYASLNSTKLYRRTGEGNHVFPVRLNDILTEGKLDTNYALQPGDIINVPERLF